MDTIETFQVHKKGVIIPKRGEVRPIHISSPGRREIDEQTVADLVKALIRDGHFLQPIVVREEGATAYRLIAGHHRLEAWKRHSCKLRPIPADIYPADTPDALITVLQIEENLLRKELSAAERQAETIRYAAALKKLDREKLATELPVLGSDAKSATRGGRGKKAATAKVADQLRLTKPAVQKRINQASAAIGEKIDLDRDTPEELERKADKRQRAEPKVVRLKRKVSPRDVTEDSTRPAEPHAGEIDNQIETWLKAFDTFGETHQFRLAYLICIRLGLDPLKMAPPAVFGLDNEEPGLPAEVAPATDAVAGQAEHGDDVAVVHAEVDDEAAAVQANQGDNSAEFGGEDLQHAGDVSEAANQEPNGANLDADHLQEAGVGSSEAANQGPGGATKCAYCKIPFECGDQLEEFSGQLYHHFCVEDGKRLAKAKQGKQIAIAA